MGQCKQEVRVEAINNHDFTVNYLRPSTRIIKLLFCNCGRTFQVSSKNVHRSAINIVLQTSMLLVKWLFSAKYKHPQDSYSR